MIATFEDLLVEAEKLLAEGQHGTPDDKWKRRVRDYFSQHERGALRSKLRELRERVSTLEEALREVDRHHTELNAKVGRDESRSHTLRTVRDALGA